MLKINLRNNTVKIPSNQIGIDIGHTLSKFAYLEGEDLILSSFPTQNNVSEIEKFLKSEQVEFKVLKFTGGKSFNMYNKYIINFEADLLNEFATIVRGIEFLYFLKKKRELTKSLIVTIGTGTSIILRDDKIRHLGGSAIGGGFFMGIVKLLYNFNDYGEVIKLAKKGNRYKVDLKVSDIYSSEDNRIDLLFREFTAATLGKVDENVNITNLKKEDIINSIICMIGENLGTIGTVIAEKNDVKDIVFCGGFLIENSILQKILSSLCIVKNKKAIFLKNSEFCAAIGALLS